MVLADHVLDALRPQAVGERARRRCLEAGGLEQV
jgi:hypothetical protein